jgi:hypothetical protein
VSANYADGMSHMQLSVAVGGKIGAASVDVLFIFACREIQWALKNCFQNCV